MPPIPSQCRPCRPCRPSPAAPPEPPLGSPCLAWRSRSSVRSTCRAPQEIHRARSRWPGWTSAVPSFHSAPVRSRSVGTPREPPPSHTRGRLTWFAIVSPSSFGDDPGPPRGVMYTMPVLRTADERGHKRRKTWSRPCTARSSGRPEQQPTTNPDGADRPEITPACLLVLLGPTPVTLVSPRSRNYRHCPPGRTRRFRRGVSSLPGRRRR